MQRGGGRDNLFGGLGDPFAGFGGIGGQPGSLMPNFFGGRDPFEDPFFTRPFGNMMGPSMFGRSMMGPNMVGPSMMGPNMVGPSLMGPNMFGPSMMIPSMSGPSLFGPNGSPFGEFSNAGFLEQQAPPPPSTSRGSRGPIIKELGSDDEEEEDATKIVEEKNDKSRKHSRPSKDPYVQDPDEEVEEKRSRHVQKRSEFNRVNTMTPQTQAYSFRSSTVTYGGSNGAYYSSSSTRRMGGDGVVMEESKEADTATGKATHRISRGIHDKGHSLTRKLNSDGRVDALQTLHNLNADELPGFDEAWKGKATQHLPGWNEGLDMLDNGSTRNNARSSRHDQQPQRGWALPSTEQQHGSARARSKPQNSSFGRRA